jgi:CheY-like chemotaxis protein
LYNYLSNSLKFTGPGGRVEVELSAEGRAEFRLAVSDTGVGISAADLGRLFVDFQQLDASTSKRYQGTGLGLALTKRLVEAQGGRVGAESMPGQGSTFFVVLPRMASQRGSVNPTVLAIEDQNPERLMLARILRGAGYAVETAASREEALDKCYRWSFDAITLDVLLPDGPGWELLGKIRSIDHHRNTPVVVISMLKEDDLKQVPIPVQGFLTKPVDGAGLLAVLERIGLPIRHTKDQNGSTAYSNRG